MEVFFPKQDFQKFGNNDKKYDFITKYNLKYSVIIPVSIQVGGAGVDGINHRNNFSSSFHKLCVTIHKLLDKFFEDETEIEQFDVSNEKDFLVPGVLRSSRLDQYIENCITFIKIMMM